MSGTAAYSSLAGSPALTDPVEAPPALDVVDLRVTFTGSGREVPAVAGVSFVVEAGQTLGIVGESGSGKSVTARAIMGLLGPSARIFGSARVRGEEMVGLSDREMRHHRGSDLAMVFQDPTRSLNPTMQVGAQVAEAIRLHRQMSRREAREEAVSLLSQVRVSDPERRAGEYPHQLSGGMRQRVMMAMALSSRPAVLIADEPTTALDVTTQAQILALLDDLKARFNMGIVLITHDMGVAAGHTDRLAVMYAGRLVETGPTPDMFQALRMPYSQALLDAIPTLDQESHSLLASIEGSPPDLAHLPVGCSFSPRCRYRRERCQLDRPDLVEGEPGHSWACWFPLGLPG